MNVLVNGIGNIGTTVLSVLTRFRKELGIDTIYALKSTLLPWQDADLETLKDLGVVVCTAHHNPDYVHLDTVRASVHYVFDCTNNGGGLRNKALYESWPGLQGASAQGSEKHFGVPYMSGINDELIRGERFVQIVSCNTHSIAALLTTFAGTHLEALEEADFVIVRRSEDIGNHQRLVSANVVARHLDPVAGTHHSIDVLDLFATLGKTWPITSSDVTTPSQLMHGVRFHLKLKTLPDTEWIQEGIAGNPYVASSVKFDSNVIFERGRRWGFQGRIYNHAVVISNNMLCNGHHLIGWAFIPQEGNTILSTIHAFLLQTGHADTDTVMHILHADLLRREW